MNKDKLIKAIKGAMRYKYSNGVILRLPTDLEIEITISIIADDLKREGKHTVKTKHFISEIVSHLCIIVDMPFLDDEE